MEKMTVRIMTPDEIVFEGQATRIDACGWDGYFTILPHHAPMAASLGIGEIEIDIEGEGEDEIVKNFVAIDSGIAEVAANHVDILTQLATMAKERGAATVKMAKEQDERQKQNIKGRDQLIKSEMELYRLLSQANESL